MSEEIFGDKAPHQVSVSEGSSNAGSSRGRSGKFKADTTRRISVNAEEGELVSRQIHHDSGTGLDTAHDPHLAAGSGDADPNQVAIATSAQASGQGPQLAGNNKPDHRVSMEAAGSDENRVNLPGTDPAQANLAHIDEGGLADNVVALPRADAAGDNRAHLTADAVADHRISLPGQADAAEDEPLITDADVLHRKPAMPNTASAPAPKGPTEASPIPHSEPLAKAEGAGHSAAAPASGVSPHREALPSEGLQDHHVALPANEPTAAPEHAQSPQALHDHHEPVPGAQQGTNVQHLHLDSEGLRELEIGHQAHEAGHDPEVEPEEIAALAHTHIEDDHAAPVVEVHEENRPAPQAIKLQADLWREGFRGRVAQIKEQVALIHENLDKLEQS